MLADIDRHWIVFWYWLLWIILLWTFVCGHIFFFFLGRFLVVKVLCHVLSLYLTFKETAELSFIAAAQFTFPVSLMWGLQLCFVLFLLVSTWWCLCRSWLSYSSWYVVFSFVASVGIPNEKWWCASFLSLLAFYISSWVKFIQFFCLLLNWVVFLFISQF